MTSELDVAKRVREINLELGVNIRRSTSAVTELVWRIIEYEKWVHELHERIQVLEDALREIAEGRYDEYGVQTETARKALRGTTEG